MEHLKRWAGSSSLSYSKAENFNLWILRNILSWSKISGFFYFKLPCLTDKFILKCFKWLSTYIEFKARDSNLCWISTHTCYYLLLLSLFVAQLYHLLCSLWLFTFNKKFTFHFLGHISLISSVQWSYVASDYCIGQRTCRAFPSLQKVLLDSTNLCTRIIYSSESFNFVKQNYFCRIISIVMVNHKCLISDI